MDAARFKKLAKQFKDDGVEAVAKDLFAAGLIPEYKLVRTINTELGLDSMVPTEFLDSLVQQLLKVQEATAPDSDVFDRLSMLVALLLHRKKKVYEPKSHYKVDGLQTVLLNGDETIQTLAQQFKDRNVPKAIADKIIAEILKNRSRSNKLQPLDEDDPEPEKRVSIVDQLLGDIAAKDTRH